MGSVETLIAYCQENGRVCPQPQKWLNLWEMLPKDVETGASQAPLPLILAAWHETPAMLKMLRLADHIRWAEKHGSLPAVAAFLRNLGEDDWHHVGE
jgi:hypothetical protein